MPIPDSARAALRVFHGVAAEVAAGCAARESRGRSLKVVHGYLHDEAPDAFRQMCVPLRRMLLPTDKANLAAVCRLLADLDAFELRARADDICRDYATLVEELETPINFGGRRVLRGDIFRAWLDRTIFYDDAEKCRPFEQMADELGHSIHPTVEELADRMAGQILALDALLVEGGILPPNPPPAPRPVVLRRPQTLAERLREAVGGLFSRRKS